jgi:hypothetical protein
MEFVALVCTGAWMLSGRVVAAQEVRGGSPEMARSIGGGVYGTVSTSAGAAVARARIEVLGTPDTITADSTGTYVLTSLPAGITTLQITGQGFDQLTVRVLVPSTGRVRVDLILSRSVSAILPESLPPILVQSAMRAAMRAAIDDPAKFLTHTPGIWEWKGDIADAPETSGEPDVFRLLVSDPHAMIQSDGFGGTSIEAAAGNVTDRIFVDGLPVWNPLHGTRSLGAINPDVVSALSVSDESVSASSGDALFETVDLQTREATVTRPSLGIGLGPRAEGGWWGSPLRIGAVTGQLLIAARRSSPGIFPDKSDFNSVTDSWNDGIAVLSLRRRSTAIQLIALGSGDNLAADVDDAMIGAKPDAGSAGGQDPTLEVPWHSRTVGSVWTQQVSPTRTLVTRMWNAQFETTANSSARGLGGSLSNWAREAGFGTQLNLASLSVGVSAQSVRTSYNKVAPPDGDLRSLKGGGVDTDTTVATQSSYPLRGRSTILAAYAERRWGNAKDRWTATSGIRATALSGGTPLLEPRLSMSVDLPHAVVATVGYASTHQFVQSVRDVTSAGGVLVPVSFPVAAGPGGAPVASAQSFTADLSRDFGTFARLTIDAYDRKFKGVITPAVSSSFAATGESFNTMNGRTIGIGTSLQSVAKNVTTRMTYGVQHTTLSPESVSYLSPTELAQTVTAAVEWRAAPMTRLRILSSIGSSFPTTSFADGDVVESGANFGGDVIGGESRSLDGEQITSDRLPVYMRTDLSAIREWSTSDRGKLGLTLTLANVFNRSNMIAFLPGDGHGGEQVIALTPRSFLAGITWRH